MKYFLLSIVMMACLVLTESSAQAQCAGAATGRPLLRTAAAPVRLVGALVAGRRARIARRGRLLAIRPRARRSGAAAACGF